MKRTLALSALLCAFFCMFTITYTSAAGKPVPDKPFDYSCSYYDATTGKYYCVETTAACNIAHAFVKESGTSGSPTLIVLTYIGNANGCQLYEGSLQLPNNRIIVVNVTSCGCGSNLTTYVRFFPDLAL
jgi:hypothetical protein